MNIAIKETKLTRGVEVIATWKDWLVIVHQEEKIFWYFRWFANKKASLQRIGEF